MANNESEISQRRPSALETDADLKPPAGERNGNKVLKTVRSKHSNGAYKPKCIRSKGHLFLSSQFHSSSGLPVGLFKFSLN